MTPKKLQKFLTKMIAQRMPVMIQGSPGIGKTDIVMAATMAAGGDLLSVYCATSDPMDPKGMPATWFDQSTQKQVADFLPFGYMNKIINATKLLVVFLDDLGQAPPAVQAAFMNLILARKTGDGTPISEHVVFVAATNRRQDKANVSGILEPVKSRFFTIVELECDLDDWVDWAIEKKLDPRGISFVKFRDMKVLNDFQPSLDLTNCPSPRTVTQALKMLPFLDDDEMVEALAGACGRGWADEFTGFCRILKAIPNPDLIKANQSAVQVPTEASVQFALTLNLGRICDEYNADNIIGFMMRMNADYWPVFKKVALTQNSMISQTAAYIAAESKFAKLTV